MLQCWGGGGWVEGHRLPPPTPPPPTHKHAQPLSPMYRSPKRVGLGAAAGYPAEAGDACICGKTCRADACMPRVDAACMPRVDAACMPCMDAACMPCMDAACMPCLDLHALIWQQHAVVCQLADYHPD